MDKQVRLIGAYGRDRKEFLKYKSALFQAKKQTRIQLGTHKAKAIPRKSETPRKMSEVRPHPHSQSPVSHRTLSHKELAKRESVQDRSATPDSIKDTTLSNYFWTQEQDDLDTSITLINGQAPRTGPKLIAVVVQNEAYYEKELKKHLNFPDEGEKLEERRGSKLALREQDQVNGYLTPSYSLEPQVEIPKPKNDSFKKLTRRVHHSEVKSSIVKGLPTIRVSDEVPAPPHIQPGRRIYKLKEQASPRRLTGKRMTVSPTREEEEQELRQLKLEESIQELDDLLLKLRKKQSIRSSSVVKDVKNKSVHQRRRLEKLLPRLKLPHLSAHE